MFRKTLIPIISFITIFSCSKNESVNDTSIELENESKYGTSADAASPLIFRTFTEEGDVNFYGTKDNDGVSVSVDYVTVQTEDYDDPILIDLLDNGNVESISSPNGEYIKIEYLDDNNVNILAIAENGNQVYFQSNLDAPIGEGEDITYLSKNSLNKTKNAIPNKAYNRKNTTNLNVNLTMDGQPFDNANVILLARGTDYSGQLLNNYGYEAKPKTIENGVFSFYIPEPSPIEINFNAVCSGAENVLGKLCLALAPLVNTTGPATTTYLCAQIALAFNVAGLPAYGTCEVVTKSLLLYCSTLGASPTEGEGNFAQLICKKINTPTKPSKYKISAGIYINGGGVYVLDADQNQDVTGPFDDMTFEIPEQDSFRIYAGLYNGFWSGTTTQVGWITGNLNTWNTGIWVNIDENGEVLYNYNSRSFRAEYGGGVIEKGPKLFGIIHKDYGNGNITDIIFQNVPIDNIGGTYSIEINTTEDWNGPLLDPGQSLSVAKTYSFKKSIN